MSPRASSFRKCSRWVVKAGSNMIVSGGPLLIRDWMHQVAALRRRYGVEVIWVTSGAIATARERVDKPKAKGEPLAVKQALSAIGQPMVMDLYNLSLGSVGLPGAQVLLTGDDLGDPKRRRNLKNTLEQLLSWQVTPVLNENDAVATEEIQFGDNDSLSARVAGALGADRLVILTDVEGFYEADPRVHPSARLITELPRVQAAQLKAAGKGGGTARGTGGMYSKLSAARLAGTHGVETWLVKGDRPGILLEVAADAPVGTRIGRRASGSGRAGRK